eukprot:6013795-Pyramimonas_sp.AAC.1
MAPLSPLTHYLAECVELGLLPGAPQRPVVLDVAKQWSEHSSGLVLNWTQLEKDTGHARQNLQRALH